MIKQEFLKSVRSTLITEKESNIYGNTDGLSLQNLFVAKFNRFPAAQMFNNSSREEKVVDVEGFLYYLFEKYPTATMIPYFSQDLSEEVKDGKETACYCVLLEEDKIFIRVQKAISQTYILFDNASIDKVQEIKEALRKTFYVKEEDIEENRYWRIALSQSGYYLEKGKIKVPSITDISLLFEDDFLKEDERIREFIEKDKESGLVILHGEMGTGKSCYIKTLIHNYPKKKFIYLPPQLVDNLGDPALGNFLNTLSDSIIVLEDCENAIRDRNTSMSSASVSLLLNMTDGILADDLSIKFICTFNDDMRNIDQALLRRGRLVSKYCFEKLSVDKANNLLKEIGSETEVNEPMALADIFNIDDPSYNNVRRKIELK